jgi:hypothetical protein
MLADITALAALEQRTAEQEVRLFCLRTDLGLIRYAEAVALRDKLPSPPSEMGVEVERRLLVLEVEDRLKGARGVEGAAAAGKHFAAMVAAGRVPRDAGFTTVRFWLAVSEHAKATADASLLQKAIDGVKAALGDDSRYQPLYDQLQAALDKIHKHH